jgi:hypothetical protein
LLLVSVGEARCVVRHGIIAIFNVECGGRKQLAPRFNGSVV